VVGSLNDVSANKMDRWQRLVLEAAEQSGRGKLPVVRPAILFLQACEEAGRSGGLSLIPWEEERGTGLRKLLVMEGTKELGGTQRNFRPFSVNLFIGPEGGFTHDEISKAKSYGLIPITLGPRILRSETAGLVVASAILYELGDLESRRA
jgi:16S rRNA (uracil1498-N3)-methyltransferase